MFPPFPSGLSGLLRGCRVHQRHERAVEGGELRLSDPPEHHRERAETVRPRDIPVSMQLPPEVRAGRDAFLEQRLDLLDAGLGQAIGGRVVGGGDLVDDVVVGQVVLKFFAGELRPPVRPDDVG